MVSRTISEKASSYCIARISTKLWFSLAFSTVPWPWLKPSGSPRHGGDSEAPFVGSWLKLKVPEVKSLRISAEHCVLDA